MSQPFTRAEIEFLPVYVPSEEERADAKTYARNVREVSHTFSQQKFQEMLIKYLNFFLR